MISDSLFIQPVYMKKADPTKRAGSLHWTNFHIVFNGKEAGLQPGCWYYFLRKIITKVEKWARLAWLESLNGEFQPTWTGSSLLQMGSPTDWFGLCGEIWYKQVWLSKWLKLLWNTVKPLYIGHHRDLEEVSAVRRCPLYEGLTFSSKEMALTSIRG